MTRVLLVIVGSLLLLLGVVLMVSPIPGPTFLIALGVVLLICSSPWFRQCVQFLRSRIKLFNRLMMWMETKMGQRIGSILKLTQPGYEPRVGDHGT